MRVRVCDCMISFSCLVQSQEQTITITIQCNNYSLFFCTKANGRFKRNLLEQPCRVENSYIFILSSSFQIPNNQLNRVIII